MPALQERDLHGLQIARRNDIVQRAGPIFRRWSRPAFDCEGPADSNLAEMKKVDGACRRGPWQGFELLHHSPVEIRYLMRLAILFLRRPDLHRKNTLGIEST